MIKQNLNKNLTVSQYCVRSDGQESIKTLIQPTDAKTSERD